MTTGKETTKVCPGDLLMLRRETRWELVAVLSVYTHRLTGAGQANIVVLGQKSDEGEKPYDLADKMPSEHIAQLLASGDAKLLFRFGENR